MHTTICFTIKSFYADVALTNLRSRMTDEAANRGLETIDGLQTPTSSLEYNKARNSLPQLLLLPIKE